MALFQTGEAYTGAPFAEVEYYYRTAMVTLDASETLYQGQVVCRDLTQLSGYIENQVSGGAGSSTSGNIGLPGAQTDMVVTPKHTAAGLPYGVYQGTSFKSTNSSVAQSFGPFKFLSNGYGKVAVGAQNSNYPTVSVGNSLIITTGSSGLTAALSGSATLNETVGMALATGNTVTYNGVLLDWTHLVGGYSFLVINADILIR